MVDRLVDRLRDIGEQEVDRSIISVLGILRKSEGPYTGDEEVAVAEEMATGAGVQAMCDLVFNEELLKIEIRDVHQIFTTISKMAIRRDAVRQSDAYQSALKRLTS